MNKLIFFFLVCLLEYQFAQVNAGSLSQTIEVTGPGCSICEGPNGPGGNYACSSWGIPWNDGLFNFQDLIPPNNVLTQITMKLHGVWGCSDDQALVNVTLQGTNLQTELLFGQCQCFTCDAEETFVWSNEGFCFPNYNYNGANIVQVNVLSGLICLHEIVMNLTYALGDQQLCQQFTTACDSFGGCGNGTCIIDPQTNMPTCNCSIDIYGPGCSCFVPSYLLETNDPPVLDVANSGFKTKNTLYLTVDNSVKYFDTSITFKNSINNTCDYPKASDAVVWSKNFNQDNCTYTYQGIIPWDIAWPVCVFDREDQVDWLVFLGEMIIENKENLGPISQPPNGLGDIIRTIVSRLLFEVRFPKTIEFFNSVQVYSNVDISAAIVEQIYQSGAPPNPGTAFIKLMTIVQYPFELTSPVSITGDSSKFSLSINEINNCQGSTNTCIQYWMINISPNENQCNFDGTYTFDFTLDCTIPDCPLDSNSNKGSIVFILQSEDFCPQIIDNIDLTGSFSSFEDAQHSVHKNSFLLGQEVYFQAEVSSNQATVTSTIVDQFSVTLSNNVNVLLYDVSSGGNTNEGNLVNLQVFNDLNNGLECDLQLQMNSIVFPVGVNQNNEVTFQITLDVTYFNTQTKRDTSGSQTINIKQTVTGINPSYPFMSESSKLGNFLTLLI